MKKTITSMALLVASAQAMALVPVQIEKKTVCLNSKVYKYEDGSKVIGSCDETNNNIHLKKEIKQNGCAEGQTALSVTKQTAIQSCMPPGVIQL